jgi:replicative DNA helicase
MFLNKDIEIMETKIVIYEDANGEIRDLKAFDEKFEAYISSLDLDVDRIKNKKVEYLYDNFIVKNCLLS